MAILKCISIRDKGGKMSIVKLFNILMQMLIFQSRKSLRLNLLNRILTTVPKFIMMVMLLWQLRKMKILNAILTFHWLDHQILTNIAIISLFALLRA